MATNFVRIDPDASIEEALRNLPDNAIRFLQRATKSLAVATYDKQRLLEQTLKSGIGNPPDLESLAGELGVPEEEVGKLASALTLFAALVTAFKDTPINEIAEALIGRGILESDDVAAISEWLNAARRHTPQLKSEIQDLSLANEVLPSLRSFRYAMDIRLKREEGALLAVPVAVAYINTDAQGQRIWFQMTHAQAKLLSRQIATLLKQFDDAEELTTSMKKP